MDFLSYRIKRLTDGKEDFLGGESLLFYESGSSIACLQLMMENLCLDIYIPGFVNIKRK